MVLFPDLINKYFTTNGHHFVSNIIVPMLFEYNHGCMILYEHYYNLHEIIFEPNIPSKF